MDSLHCDFGPYMGRFGWVEVEIMNNFASSVNYLMPCALSGFLVSFRSEYPGNKHWTSLGLACGLWLRLVYRTLKDTNCLFTFDILDIPFNSGYFHIHFTNMKMSARGKLSSLCHFNKKTILIILYCDPMIRLFDFKCTVSPVLIDHRNEFLHLPWLPPSRSTQYSLITTGIQIDASRLWWTAVISLQNTALLLALQC